MQILAILLVGSPLIACSAEVVKGDAYGVWLKKPFIGSGSPDEVAAEHCAEYGKTAEFKGSLESRNQVFLPLRSYDCK